MNVNRVQIAHVYADRPCSVNTPLVKNGACAAILTLVDADVDAGLSPLALLLSVG